MVIKTTLLLALSVSGINGCNTALFQAVLRILFGSGPSNTTYVTNEPPITLPLIPCKVIAPGPATGQICIFPFTWSETDKTYRECAYEPAMGDPYPWCSTLVDQNATHIIGGGHWGKCDPHNCPVPTVSPPIAAPPPPPSGGCSGVGEDCNNVHLGSSSSDQADEFQNLINKAKDRGKITLKVGNHYLSKTVHINKPNLIIIGEEGSIIRKTGGVSAIDIGENGHNTRIENIYIDGGNLSEPCMRVFSSHNHILGSTFRNSGNSGLLFHGSNFNIIDGCKMSFNFLVGLSQWDSRNNQIANCQMIENGAEGITVDGHSHNSLIHHNWIHRNNLLFRGVGGVGIDASDGVTIYKNTIDYNGLNGITFQNNLCGGCSNATIHDNDSISFNVGAAIGKRYNDQPIDNLEVYRNKAEFNVFGEQYVIPDKTNCVPV